MILGRVKSLGRSKDGLKKKGCQEIRKRDIQSALGATLTGRRGSLPVRENTLKKTR